MWEIVLYLVGPLVFSIAAARLVKWFDKRAGDRRTADGANSYDI